MIRIAALEVKSEAMNFCPFLTQARGQETMQTLQTPRVDSCVEVLVTAGCWRSEFFGILGESKDFRSCVTPSDPQTDDGPALRRQRQGDDLLDSELIRHRQSRRRQKTEPSGQFISLCAVFMPQPTASHQPPFSASRYMLGSLSTSRPNIHEDTQIINLFHHQ
jgi:hypothetical protein